MSAIRVLLFPAVMLGFVFAASQTNSNDGKKELSGGETAMAVTTIVLITILSLLPFLIFSSGGSSVYLYIYKYQQDQRAFHKSLHAIPRQQPSQPVVQPQASTNTGAE